MPEIEDLILIIIVVATVIAFFRSLAKSDVVMEMNNSSAPPFITQQKQQNVSRGYDPALIQKVAFNLMETLYIMNTTIAVDTIVGRYRLLISSIGLLQLSQNSIRYNSDIQMAIDNYKTTYYDRVPDDFQLTALTNPTRFDVAFFYCSCLLSGLRKYISAQTKEINFLQKSHAQQKHIDKIISFIQMVRKELIDKCGSLQNISSLIAQLDDTEEGYRNLKI